MRRSTNEGKTTAGLRPVPSSLSLLAQGKVADNALVIGGLKRGVGLHRGICAGSAMARRSSEAGLF